jgi:hypothetical protein
MRHEIWVSQDAPSANDAAFQPKAIFIKGFNKIFAIFENLSNTPFMPVFKRLSNKKLLP